MCTWPRWNADGSLLAFMGYTEASGRRHSSLFSAIPESRASPTLQAADLSTTIAWCWGPDAKTITYVPKLGGPPRPPGSMAKPIHPDWAGGVQGMAWNSEGSMLACAIIRADTLAVGVRVLDRSCERDLYQSPVSLDVARTVWSPDGKRLLVSARDPGDRPVISIVDLRSGRAVALQQGELLGAMPVAWVVGNDGKDRMFFRSSEGTTLLMSAGPDAPVIPVVSVDARGIPRVLEQSRRMAALRACRSQDQARSSARHGQAFLRWPQPALLAPESSRGAHHLGGMMRSAGPPP